MHIGILQADSVLPQFQPDFGNYPEMFRDILGRAGGESVRFTIYDVEHGEYPLSLDECDGYVITGSKKSVYDDEPWIHELAEFVRSAHEARKKLVGVCFGHQMVAQALGGKTEPAAGGWGVGIHRSKLVKQPAFLSDDLDAFNLVVSHKDQVTRLPPDAELLATSDFCPNAMFQIGEHILTVQGHPEFVKGYSKALMEFRKDILGNEKFSAGVASLDEPLDRDIVAKWIVNFIGESA